MTPGDPSGAAIATDGTADVDHELEAAVHEDFAEFCRAAALGVRPAMSFTEYRRVWLAGWNAREEVEPTGITHDSEGR